MSSFILAPLCFCMLTNSGVSAFNIGILKGENDPSLESLLSVAPLKIVGIETLSSLGSTTQLLHKACKLMYRNVDAIVSTTNDLRSAMLYDVAERHRVPFITTNPSLLDSEKDYKWAASIVPPFKASFPVLDQMFKLYEWSSATVMSSSVLAEQDTAAMATCASTDVASSAFPYRIERVPQLVTLDDRLSWIKHSGYLNIIVYGDVATTNEALDTARKLNLTGPAYKWILFNHPMGTIDLKNFEEMGHMFNVVPSVAGLESASEHLVATLQPALLQLAAVLGENPTRKFSQNYTMNGCLSLPKQNDTSYFRKLHKLARDKNRRVFMKTPGLNNLAYDVWYYDRKHGNKWIRPIHRFVPSDANSTGSGHSDNGTVKNHMYPQGSQFVNQYPPLFGVHLDLVANHETPYIIYDKEKKTYSGFMMDVFDEIAKQFGVTYTIRYQDFGFYNITGGYWTGMFGDVFYEWNTICISSIYVTQQRERDFDLTYPLWATGYSFVIKRETYDNRWIFLKPFHTHLWWTIIGTAIAAAVLITCLNKVSPYERRGEWIYAYEDLTRATRRQRLYYKVQKVQLSAFNFLESLFFCCAMLTKSGWWTYPWSSSCRLVVSGLIFLTSIMISSYTAQLSARKTLAKLSTVVDDIDGLMEMDNMVIGSNNYDAPLYAFLNKSNEKKYKMLKQRMMSIDEYWVDPVGAEKARNERFAYVWTAGVLNSHVGSAPCDLRRAKEMFGRTMISFMLRKHSPYTKDLNTAIIRLDEDGKLQEIMNKWVNEFSQCNKLFPSSINAEGKDFANAWDMKDIFIVLGFALMISLVFFVLEILYSLRSLPAKVKEEGFSAMVRYRIDRVNRDIWMYYNPVSAVKKRTFRATARAVTAVTSSVSRQSRRLSIKVAPLYKIFSSEPRNSGSSTTTSSSKETKFTTDSLSHVQSTSEFNDSRKITMPGFAETSFSNMNALQGSYGNVRTISAMSSANDSGMYASRYRYLL